MRSHNHNKAIMHLAMPERQIPVLIEASSEKAEGFVPSIAWSDKPVTSVRRLQPSFVDGLGYSGKRREIEKEHGAIKAAEWNRLRALLALKDRLNSGDWSPVTSPDVVSELSKALNPLAALLNKISPGGWLIEEDESRRRTYRSASCNARASISFEMELGTFPVATSVAGSSVRKPGPNILSNSGRDKKDQLWSTKIGISGTYKTAAFALSEAFTAGLSKTRFVVWWHDASKRFVPGLYCPDIVTALYALAMWSSGTAGGWAICQKCRRDFARKRTKQLYCSTQCQAAAAMRRLRQKRKQDKGRSEN
jgi:hypothetical protein